MEKIIFFLPLFLIVLFYPQDVFGGAWYPCCMEWSLEKTEYQPGETVTITVIGSEDLEHFAEPISVKISDVTFGPDYEKVVFEEQKTIENGKAIFEYKLSKNSDSYRYLVNVDTPSYNEPKMIFTKKDASKIVISDFKILNPVLKQGEPIKFEAKVVDGVGNPAHYFRITISGNIPHQSCDPQTGGNAGAHLDVSPLYSIQPDYWSKGIVRGEVPISNTAMLGKHELNLYAGGEFRGYQENRQSFEIEIESYDGPRDPPYTVFGLPFDLGFEPGFMTEQEINFTGRTTYNGCGPVLANVPIKVEIKEYDIVSSHWLRTIATQEVTSDENGFYNVYFEPIGLQAGYFSVLFTTDYPGVTGTFSIETPRNMKNFTINAEGKEFLIETDTWYSIPLNVEFFQEEKKLTFDVDTSDSYKGISIKVPHELLDGEYIILENGVDRSDMFQKIENYTIFRLNANSDKTHLEIIGTSAIPEFGFVFIILASSVTAIILFTRLGMKI